MIDRDSKILVLCTGNSCRSQMTEGFLRHHLPIAGQRSTAAKVRSAGLEAHGLNPLAVKVMNEVGIDISGQESECLDKYLEDEFDFVITVCDNAASHCPIFPGEGVRIHWPFDDPAGATGSEQQVLAEFRRVRDQIDRQVRAFLDL